MTTYFATKGKENARATCELAVQRAVELGIKHIVVATTDGNTPPILLDLAEGKGIHIVVVTHVTGHKSPGVQECAPERRREFISRGADVLTTTHIFANVERSITKQFSGLYPGGIISATLRCFGQGTKVCFEIAVMAKDAGLVPHGEEIIAIAGTGRGADTAMVLKPGHGQDFFSTEVMEYICKPRGR